MAAVSAPTDTGGKSFVDHPYEKIIFVGLQTPVRMGNLLDVIKSHPILACVTPTTDAPAQLTLAPGPSTGPVTSIDKVEFSCNIPHIYEIKALHWYLS